MRQGRITFLSCFSARKRTSRRKRKSWLRHKSLSPPRVLLCPRFFSDANRFRTKKSLRHSIMLSRREGLPPRKIRSYVSRPQNFSERDWHRVEEQKKKTESMLQELKKKNRNKKSRRSSKTTATDGSTRRAASATFPCPIAPKAGNAPGEKTKNHDQTPMDRNVKPTGPSPQH